MAKIKISAKSTWKEWLKFILLVVASMFCGAGVDLAVRPTNTEELVEIEATSTLELSDEQLPAVTEDDQGEIEEGEIVPTVESVDGGQFEDEATGVSAVETEGEYSDLGWSETYDTSSPEAFKNATLGKCIIANNVYGAQCVSLSRVFWWSYANRDVSTCGTGLAKGMMLCSEQNAGNEFNVYGNEPDKIQAGDWLIFDGVSTGHVAMALGPVHNGYVTVLGENQGGASCGVNIGGSATNIINISVKNLIGFYRPKAYEAPEPTPEPESEPKSETGEVKYTYVEGDYFSKVLVELGLDEGNLWGEDGTVAYYTEQLVAQDVLDEHGNVKIGEEFTLTRKN